MTVVEKSKERDVTSHFSKMTNLVHHFGDVLLSESSSSSSFRAGDVVRVVVSAWHLSHLRSRLEESEERPLIEAVLRHEVGVVHRITSTGNVRVQFEGRPRRHFRWTMAPQTLRRV